MNMRFLSIAFAIGCLTVTPMLAQGSDGTGGRQANASGPRGGVVARSGTAKPKPAWRTPSRTRTRAGRRAGVIAQDPHSVDPNEQGSDPVDTAPPPSAVSTFVAPSLIQPLLRSAAPQPSQPIPHGNLWLAVGPVTAQVYVDGFYVGTVEDSHRTPEGLNLAAGWHRLEFRALGYETPAVNVTIEANRMVSHQGELRPTRP
jgi:PEGA domain